MTSEATLHDDQMETAVADYLAAHTDFFHRHPELAAAMTLPHPQHDKTVSLVDRQVGLLREQKLELKHKLQHLAQVARGNEQLLERLQRLILDLIDSRDLENALQLLETAMRRDFHADAVTVWLFGEGAEGHFIAHGDARARPFEQLLAQGHPACGMLKSEQLSGLFDSGSDIASAALIPLCEGEGSACLGLLGIGSIDPKRYHAEMGTVFLAHLGAVAARVIRARMDRGT